VTTGINPRRQTLVSLLLLLLVVAKLISLIGKGNTRQGVRHCRIGDIVSCSLEEVARFERRSEREDLRQQLDASLGKNQAKSKDENEKSSSKKVPSSSMQMYILVTGFAPNHAGRVCGTVLVTAKQVSLYCDNRTTSKKSCSYNDVGGDDGTIDSIGNLYRALTVFDTRINVEVERKFLKQLLPTEKFQFDKTKCYYCRLGCLYE
jgi:hypothetical protein